ncbi:MAG: protein translocase subunit SecDF [Prolixibacteraceae bacterium]|jgi:SecD/SecF fusion protein|nr:protein translocase subunit SecDF [Prolixibacteraceae bacterium]
MQNKGAVRLFAILLALVCVYQLSFTFVSQKVKNDAADYAQGDLQKESYYLDSISGETVYNFLGIRKYDYKDVQAREINLGLDLKGGMNVTLEVSLVDLVRSLSNNSTDSTFNAALNLASQRQKSSQEDFINLFAQAFEEIDPNAKLAANFLTPELKERINFNSSNSEVIEVIKEEADAAIDNTFNILRTRIDRFGVAQPNIQKLAQRGRILVELPGIKDKDRVRNLLQSTASLEFWETYENQEVYPYLLEVNEYIKEIQDANNETEEVADEQAEEVTDEQTEGTDDELSLLDELSSAEGDSASLDQNADMVRDFPLFSVLTPNVNNQGQLFKGPVVGFAHKKDTSKVNRYLNMPRVRTLLPRDMVFNWTMEPFDEKGNIYQLVALKVTTRDGSAPLDGSVVTDARQDFGQTQASAEVTMNMNSEGAKTWARMTKNNIGKSIAILLDDYVVSFPTVQTEITGGRSNITGNFTVEEAKDLANMLKSGKMPAKINIVEEYVVGPSLGEQSIKSGLWSFVIAFILVLLYMLFFYSYHAGAVANVALIANLFFIIGVLASFGAVLTLPGIAGIVLTIGMSVDANVLIYERIQEERRAGKGLKLAIADGYKNALSAIIDGQVTTLLTGIVLYFFGSGPIKGFATTLIIGIATSLFSAIFITRLVFERFLGRDKVIKFTTKATSEWLQHTKIKFLEKRRIAYIISGIAILISIASISIKGLNYGIDFKGGRTYVVAFDQDVKVEDVSNALAEGFGSAPEVKTFGSANQVRITTNFLIDDNSESVDNQVEDILYQELTPFLGSDIDRDEFTQDYIQSSTKVGPTISDDIKNTAMIALALSLLVIFLYVFMRFRNWQYGIGAIAALAHDSIIVLGIFSIFSGLLPFSLEMDQAFIAAILTVLGYSINDTVVVFDRIREYVGLYPKRHVEDNIDHALNNTLRRTFSTSLSTFVVLLSIFIFGGETIRGFIFALMVGVVVGTYSSLFVATPILYDFRNKIVKKIASKK